VTKTMTAASCFAATVEFANLPPAEQTLALHLLAASRALQQTTVRNLRDTDLPRVMGFNQLPLECASVQLPTV